MVISWLFNQNKIIIRETITVIPDQVNTINKAVIGIIRYK